MTYKKKLIILLSLISVLALTYIVSFVLTAESAGSKADLYTWLDSRYSAQVSRIVINTPWDNIELVRKNNQWFISHDDREYPARQMRIEDFLGIFTVRSAWPIRYTNTASHARLRLDVENASRVTIYGDNAMLLDLLLGEENILGNEIFLRKFGQNEVRSGNNLIASYAEGSLNSWYNLRLVPETEDGRIGMDSVQRLSVYDGETQQIFSRRNREWVISGVYVENPDQSGIESYIRTILNTEGSEFIDYIFPGDPMFDHSRIVLELGSGNVRTIRLSEPDELNNRYANIAGSDYVYFLAPWATVRLFRPSADFEMR